MKPGTDRDASAELQEHAHSYAAMLRAVADRWRSRLATEHASSDATARLVEALSSAACTIESFERVAQGGSVLEKASPQPEHQANHNEERFRLLVQSVKDYAIFMLDPDGRIETWNPGAESLKGYSPAEAIGNHFSIFYPDEEKTAGKPAHALQIANAEGRYEEEGWRVRKDGTLMWASVTITAVRESSGALQGFAKVTRDFTARHTAEAALKESEERFRLMIEAIQDYAIFMLDVHGRVTSWNVGAQRIKGYLAHEIIGSSFRVFYAPEAAAAGYPERELEIAQLMGRFEEEGWRVRKDGTRFWANVILTPVRGSSGELLGFAKVTRDTTERRRAEEAMKELHASLELRVQERTDELASANKELEAFSYSVSHDLRAPLRGLDGFSKMLLASAGEKLKAEEQDYLHRIRSAAQRMSQLIDDMLSLARLSRAPLTLEQVQISEVAESILSELQLTQPARSVEFVLQPGLVARADPRLLRIVLENLLGNAWKFTSKTPATCIEVGSITKEHRVTYFVRDNGVGFNMKYASKLFTPFQRLHSAREFEGTGIGLATVNRIVRRHGGDVWVESARDRGTTFFFTLEGLR